MSLPIRVLIVDDSALVRKILSDGLGADPAIEIAGTASDPFQARDKIVQLRPDVLTLDVEMPKMTGVEFLRKLMPQYPIPVVMVSSLTKEKAQITLDALAAGAVDFVAKPHANIARGLDEMMNELRAKVKAAAKAKLPKARRPHPASAKPEDKHPAASPIEKTHPAPQLHSSEQITSFPALVLSANTDRRLIAIGASTGGTEAITRVLTRLPQNCPGIVIVQHMPEGFTKIFAERLDSICPIYVKEAEDGDPVLPGTALIAPGGSHMRIEPTATGYKVMVFHGPMVNGHRPSVEVLFDSVAKVSPKLAVGVILTGMGSDGSDAMLQMRLNGARCIAQDEETSVIFGMPGEADKKGAVEKLVPLDEIAPEIIKLLSEPVKHI